MGVPSGPFYIDDLLTFTVNTHDVSTGAGTDADSVPSYRVYEDETGTAILTGNMAKLDDANTVGFYSEQLTLSAGNGFEVGKSYSIYVAATVDSVAATQSFNFKVITNPQTLLTAIDGKTTNLPSDPADASVIAARFDTIDSTLTTIDNFLDTEIQAIKDKTDNLPSDPADASVIAGRFDTLDTSVADLPTNAELTTALGTADDAVLAQIALVRAKTDPLTFTVAGVLDVNVEYINATEIIGDGSSGNPFNSTEL